MNTATTTTTTTTIPYVSIICVTYNRKKFIPSLLESVNKQMYCKNHFELIIVDDGIENSEDCVREKKYRFPIKYYAMEKKMKLGEKRNFSHTLIDSRSTYISYFDDDDVHSPMRVLHAVQMLQQNPSYLCAGSSQMYVFFPALDQMYQFGPYMDNHATAGTITFHVRLLKLTSYDNNACFAEESSFFKNYQIPILQLHPLQTILVIAHSQNTINKDQFIEGSDFVKKSYLSPDYFLRGRQDASFFKNKLL